MELRLKDIKIGGSSMTICRSAREAGANVSCIQEIFVSIYHEVGAMTERKYEMKEDVIHKNPKIPDQITHGFDQSKIERAVNEGLLMEMNGKYILTKKTIDILEKAAQYQKEMEKRRVTNKQSKINLVSK